RCRLAFLPSFPTRRSSDLLKPVKQQSPNYYGLYDLYGMIWEWTEDFNSVMMSGESRNDQTTNETLFCSGAAVTTDDLKNYAAFIDRKSTRLNSSHVKISYA